MMKVTFLLVVTVQMCLTNENLKCVIKQSHRESHCVEIYQDGHSQKGSSNSKTFVCVYTYARMHARTHNTGEKEFSWCMFHMQGHLLGSCHIEMPTTPLEVDGGRLCLQQPDPLPSACAPAGLFE